MTIELPKIMKFEFKTIKKNLTDESPRTVLNSIMVSGPSILPNLYKYLFDSKGLNQNQLKFLSAFYGQEYLFCEQKFVYLTADNKNVVYIPDRKIFIAGISLYEIEKIYEYYQISFTRDEILDSPFDINKLKEVPLDETNSNDSND